MAQAKTPIKQGVLQGDMDAAGYRILNLDLSGLTSGAPFYDDTALIRAAGDATKLARFNISANTTGTQRIFTLPNYNGQLATLAGAEGFANKTYNGLTISDTSGELTVNNAAQIQIDGNLLFSSAFTLAGGFLTVLTVTDITSLTLPTSGTLATTSQIPTISDVAYNATTWNGNLDGASKNAIRDKFESLVLNLSPFPDNKSILYNDSDPTKLLAFSLAGFTTATTRTLTVQDANGTIALLDDLPDTAGIIFSADEVDRTFYLGGNVGFFGPFTMAGGFLTVLNSTGITDVTLPTDGTLATRAGTETLTNKTISGGSATSLTGLSIRSLVANYDLAFETSAALSVNRKLIFALGDANRTITLGGDLTIPADFIVEAAFHTQGVVSFASDVSLSASFTAGDTVAISGPFFTNGDFATADDFSTVGAFPIVLTATGDIDATLPRGTTTIEGRVAAPASAGASGVAGQVAYDTNYEYRCVATDTWKRVAIATW